MEFVIVVTTGLAAAFLATSFAPLRWRATLWAAVILACVVPWTTWQGHEHWAKVNWVPFSAVPGPLRARDLFVNLLLYFPLGLFLVRQFPATRRIVVWTTIASAVLSLVTELSQVYAHGRFPSMTDVTMNAVGGLVGAVVAWRLAPSRAPRAGAAG